MACVVFLVCYNVLMACMVFWSVLHSNHGMYGVSVYITRYSWHVWCFSLYYKVLMACMVFWISVTILKCVVWCPWLISQDNPWFQILPLISINEYGNRINFPRQNQTCRSTFVWEKDALNFRMLSILVSTRLKNSSRFQYFQRISLMEK